MIKSQACEPCAKRKVRCDHSKPCSNCKRRKLDHCTYPAPSPQDRIKQLEALVRELGGTPDLASDRSVQEVSNVEIGSQPASPSNDASKLLLASLQSQIRGRKVGTPAGFEDNSSFALEEDGQSLYMEPKVWPGWMSYKSGSVTSSSRIKLPFTTQGRPHAFASMATRTDSAATHERFPAVKYAMLLWNVFMDRVEPFIRICYRWWLKDLRIKALDPESCQQLSNAEYALVSSIYLVSVVSMAEGECQDLLHQSQSKLVSQYQLTCEEAISQTNLFCMTDITVIKAVTIYLTAGYDRLSTQSLWSLTGLAIRSAERLGMHRESTDPELNPAQVEDRRRVWWQLQQLDLGVAIRSGSTSMTLTTDWDTKLPLNMEDDDVSPTSTELPQARRGLTSMSISRFCCLMVDQQRNVSPSKQNQSASLDQPNPASSQRPDEIVAQTFEETVNKDYLQYCDPIKPLHILLQLWARFLIAGMRLQILHISAYREGWDSISHAQRDAILEVSMQCLRYNNIAQSHPELRRYRWLTKVWVPYHALMCVLVEAARAQESDKAQEIWDLLSNTCKIDTTFRDLSEDRRKHHAAELVIAAWKTWQTKSTLNLELSNSRFIEDLEERIIREKSKSNYVSVHRPLQRENNQPEVTVLTPESLAVEGDANAVFDMNFQDIDWSFWNSIDWPT